MVQADPFGDGQFMLQPPKTPLVAAVSVTAVPTGKLTAQVDEQIIPLG